MMLAFNLFRRKGLSDLICAVPEDYVVPKFINPCDWEFGGKADVLRRRLRGFDPKVATAAVRFNGFYLFQNF